MIGVDSIHIRFTFDAHRVNVNSIRIQTESSVKRPLVNFCPNKNACVRLLSQQVKVGSQYTLERALRPEVHTK